LTVEVLKQVVTSPAVVTAFFFMVVLLAVLKIMRDQADQLKLLMYIKNQLEHLRRGSRDLRKVPDPLEED
jgi:hypothetical protein